MTCHIRLGSLNHYAVTVNVMTRVDPPVEQRDGARLSSRRHPNRATPPSAIVVAVARGGRYADHERRDVCGVTFAACRADA